MRNIIRTALIVGTLATPMIAMADDAKKTDAPAAKDEKADPKADAKKTDAKKTEEKKDAPAAK